MLKKMWSGRYASQTDSEVECYTSSISFDHQLAMEDLLGSMAHANMLTHCHIITLEENTLLQNGLKNIAEKISQNKIEFKISDEDIHMNIERILTEDIGFVAGKLHTARSRNDQIALDLHLYLRKKIIFVVELLVLLQKTLLNLAKEHVNTILPGYTHLQRAQPIHLATHWLAYVAMFQRDVDRLINLWKHVNVSPLGAAALTGTSFPIDKNYVASELGFDEIYLNTIDAVSNRDYIIEFLSDSAMIMLHLSRMSEELILWSSQEFNFISFDESYCTGSSIMPQKKNPDAAELARGKTGRVYGALISVLTMLKGLPLAYNKDMQEDKEPLFDAIQTLTSTLKIYSPLLKTLTVNHGVMKNAVEDGYLNATILAEYLVKKGLSFRAAHEMVGKMVAYCICKKSRLEELSLNEMQTFSAIITNDIYQTLSPKHAAECCMPSSSINKEIDTREQTLKSTDEWVDEKLNTLKAVYAQHSLPS